MNFKHLLIGSLVIMPFAVNATTPSRHGINVANMDTTVAPGTDFYMYADGGWKKRTRCRASIRVSASLT